MLRKGPVALADILPLALVCPVGRNPVAPRVVTVHLGGIDVAKGRKDDAIDKPLHLLLPEGAPPPERAGAMAPDPFNR